MKAKFATAALLGFVLIAAAACGGGDDGLSTAEEQALQRQLEAAEEARKEAEEKAAEEERKRKEAEEAAAEEAREAAEQARQDAATAAAAEQERLREEAEEAERRRQAAEREQEQLQRQLTEAEQAELRVRASSFGTELDLGDTGGESATADVAWTRGSSLTFRPRGVTHTAGAAAPSVPGSWRSASFAGPIGTAGSLINETVYLYTNIQKPSSRAFWKVHVMTVTDRGLEVAAASAADLTTDTANNDPTPTAAAQYITDPADNTQASGVRVSGRYDGVSGTFTCTVSGTCTGTKTGITLTGLVGEPANGVRSFASGSWSFKPGSITALVKAEDQADQDDAYLYFGVWSSIPDSITASGYNFRYVAGGGAQTGAALANFDALTGSATFRGGAVGKYTTQGQVGGQNAKIGTFTATATLNANFGDGTAPGTLSGSITDFREGGSSLAGWRVTLGSTDNVGVASTIAAAAAAGSTVANVGGLSVGGSWGASFYGSDNEVLADRDKYPATRYPVVDLAGVTGWFDAVGPGTGGGPNDVALAGAFGAACTTGTMCAK